MEDVADANTDEVGSSAGLHLLLWDGPNIDMTLSTLLGGKPEPSTRPNFGSVARWLCGRAPIGGEVEACVFTNIGPDAAQRVRPWINAIRTQGFAVFAKPKEAPEDDIDDDLIRHLRTRYAEGGLAEVVVASHDFAAFEDVLLELAKSGASVVVLGFNEFAGGALRTPGIDFVDLEDLPGVFTSPLPRVDLTNLPPSGRWFAPTVRLRPMGDQLEGVVIALRDIVSQANEPVFLASVGSRLRTALPGFDHRSLGFDGLQALIASIADRAGVEMVSVGDHPALRIPPAESAPDER